MTTAVDLSLLEALRGPSVSLLTRTRIKAAGTGEVYTGFSALGRMNVAIRVDDVAGDSGSSATVLVEQSDNGLVWTTAATHTFTANDTYRVVVDDPKDQLRTRWTVAGGLRYAVVGSVAVVPGFLDPAPDGGAGLPSQSVTLSDSEIRGLPSTYIEVIPAPGAGHGLVPVLVFLLLDTEAAPYADVDSASYLQLVWGDWENDASNAFKADGALTFEQRTWFVSTVGQLPNRGGFETLLLAESGVTADIDNRPLKLVASNPSDFTGGDPANTLKVLVYYTDVGLT